MKDQSSCALHATEGDQCRQRVPETCGNANSMCPLAFFDALRKIRQIEAAEVLINNFSPFDLTGHDGSRIDVSRLECSMFECCQNCLLFDAARLEISVSATRNERLDAGASAASALLVVKLFQQRGIVRRLGQPQK